MNRRATRSGTETARRKTKKNTERRKSQAGTTTADGGPQEREPVRKPSPEEAVRERLRRRSAPGEGKAGRRILISVRDGHLSQVAVVAAGRLEEFYIDRVGEQSCLGNIYLGKVVNLEPSIGAAFVDFGEGRNGFLHVSDVNPLVVKDRVTDFIERAVDGTPRKGGTEKNIDELLRLGEELVVQVTKDGIGHKGPTLTTYVSIPGCYLVLMPTLRRLAVSRKIGSSEERRRLKEILQGMELPPGLGFIIRTAGADHPRQDLERDAQFLLRMWQLITERLRGAKAPACLYRETDLILRSVRDLFTPDTVEVVVDSEKHFRRCLEFMQKVMPQYADRVRLHDKPKPLFVEMGVDGEVEKIFQRKIELPSGGSIVIDQTEALVAIDVNSGKNKEEADLEETALKTNLEAIPEIVRQLRLRDLGGLVIIDFIDMVSERHRRRVERALRDELRRDRARFRMEGMSMFGIVELTRQRVRPSLFVAASSPCPACGGRGTVRSAAAVAATVLRRVRGEMARQSCAEIEVRLSPEVAAYLQNAHRAELLELEETFHKALRLTPDRTLGHEDMRLVYHEEVRDLAADLEHHL